MDVEYSRYNNELNTISRYYAEASELGQQIIKWKNAFKAICSTNRLGLIDSLSTPTTLQSVMVVVGKTVMFVDELCLMDFGNHDASERKNIEAKKKLQEEAKRIYPNPNEDNKLNCQLNDVYHISDIEDITNSTHRNDDNEFIIKQDRGRPTYIFTSPKRDAIMHAIRSSKARYQIAKPVSVTARTISPSGVPGLCIPANNSTFIEQLSGRLAVSETGLTLEFLSEFFVGFYKSNTSQKHLCLQYMAPWLLNLALYYRNGSEHQPHLKKTRDIIKNLIYMTTKEPELYTAILSRVWSTLKG
ncbi:2392_t:CDS:2, partial [Funneliformis caledonium]